MKKIILVFMIAISGFFAAGQTSAEKSANEWKEFVGLSSNPLFNSNRDSGFNFHFVVLGSSSKNDFNGIVSDICVFSSNSNLDVRIQIYYVDATRGVFKVSEESIRDADFDGVADKYHGRNEISGTELVALPSESVQMIYEQVISRIVEQMKKRISYESESGNRNL